MKSIYRHLPDPNFQHTAFHLPDPDAVNIVPKAPTFCPEVLFPKLAGKYLPAKCF